MIRTQVQFTDEQARRLRRAASREGISVAELVRRCVVQALGDDEQQLQAAYARAASVIGAFLDPQGGPVAEDHDHYLDEAFR